MNLNQGQEEGSSFISKQNLNARNKKPFKTTMEVHKNPPKSAVLRTQ